MPILALLTAVSIWLSAGTLVVYGGDTARIAALPSFTILGLLVVAALIATRLTRLRLEHAWPLTLSLVLWLPFLPGSLPPSVVMWEGPIEGLVWLSVVAGMIAARRPPVPKLFSQPSTAPWLAAAILAAGWLVVFSQVRAVIPGGDEPHYLAATQSLLHDGDLRVANNYAKGEYLDYFPGRLEPHFLKRATSGEIYSIHSPGVSVVVLPAFAIAGYVGAVATMILIAALTAALTWRLAFRISASAGAAWAATAAVFASAPYFFHGFTVYPEVIGSFGVMCGAWLLIELSDTHEVSARSLIAVGSALALMPWLHSRFAVLAAILGVAIAMRLAQRSNAIPNIAAFLAVPVVAGIGWFSFFYLIWGSPSPTAPYGADTSTSAGYIVRGVIGLLVDQQFGVLTPAPVYLIAAAGIVPLFKRYPRLTIELLVLVIAYVATVASYAMWWAGSAAPARFLVSILPLAALPVAAVWARSRAIGLLLLLASVAFVFPRAFVDSGRFIYNNRSGVDATLMWLTSSVDLASALPSVHRSGGSVALRDAAIWIAGLAIAATWIILVARRWAAGAQFAFTAIVMAVAVMTCAGVAWSFDHSSVYDVDRSKMATLERMRPAWQTTIVDGATWAPRSTTDLLNQLTTTFSVQSARALGRVAAGDYEIVAGESPATVDPIAIYVGRNDPPLETPTLDALRNTASPVHLRLPVTVRTLNLRIDSPRSTSGTELMLRPVGFVTPATHQAAIRAARYGRARAFFFDEWAYAEPDGFWTRANGTTEVVIDIPDAPPSELPISITAGAVATTVTMTIGSWSESWSLDAGQKRDVLLPTGLSGEWPLRISSGAGFRPSEREPGNNDVRALALWITIR